MILSDLYPPVATLSWPVCGMSCMWDVWGLIQFIVHPVFLLKISFPLGLLGHVAMKGADDLIFLHAFVQLFVVVSFGFQTMSWCELDCLPFLYRCSIGLSSAWWHQSELFRVAGYVRWLGQVPGTRAVLKAKLTVQNKGYSGTKSLELNRIQNWRM